MANTKSAAKNVRQAKRRSAVNRLWSLKIKESLTCARKSKTGDAVRAAQETLDKAARRGVIKKGKASRLKSRLMTAAHVKS